mgnify:CR=1 FL=1
MAEGSDGQQGTGSVRAAVARVVNAGVPRGPHLQNCFNVYFNVYFNAAGEAQGHFRPAHEAKDAARGQGLQMVRRERELARRAHGQMEDERHALLVCGQYDQERRDMLENFCDDSMEAVLVVYG